MPSARRFGGGRLAAAATALFRERTEMGGGSVAEKDGGGASGWVYEDRRAAVDGGRRLVAARAIPRGTCLLREETPVYVNRTSVAAVAVEGEDGTRPAATAAHLRTFFAVSAAWDADDAIPSRTVHLSIDPKTGKRITAPASAPLAPSAISDGTPAADSGAAAGATADANGDAPAAAPASAPLAPAAAAASGDAPFKVSVQSNDVVWQLVDKLLFNVRTALAVEADDAECRQALEAMLLRLDGSADSVDAFAELPLPAEDDPDVAADVRVDEPAIAFLLRRHKRMLPDNDAVAGAARRRLLQVAQFIETHRWSSYVVTEQRAYGAGVWFRASAVQHACDSNALLLTVRNECRLYAWCDIAAGDEVTACYAQGLNLMALEPRRELLRARFGFTCRCTLCEEDERRGPQPAPAPLSEALGQALRNFHAVRTGGGLPAETLATYADVMCAVHAQELPRHPVLYERVLYYALLAAVRQMDAEQSLDAAPLPYGAELGERRQRLLAIVGRRQRLMRVAIAHLHRFSAVLAPLATNYYLRVLCDAAALVYHEECRRTLTLERDARAALDGNFNTRPTPPAPQPAAAAASSDADAPEEMPPLVEVSQTTLTVKAFIEFHLAHTVSPETSAAATEKAAEQPSSVRGRDTFWALQADAVLLQSVAALCSLGSTGATMHFIKTP
jgi:hypothetical protein